MKVNEFKVKIPKEDEIALNTVLLSENGDFFVVEVFGAPYEISKQNIIDIETCEGTVITGGKGKPVTLLVKKDCELHCRTKIKAGDLAGKCQLQFGNICL